METPLNLVVSCAQCITVPSVTLGPGFLCVVSSSMFVRQTSPSPYNSGRQQEMQLALRIVSILLLLSIQCMAMMTLPRLQKGRRFVRGPRSTSSLSLLPSKIHLSKAKRKNKRAQTASTDQRYGLGTVVFMLAAMSSSSVIVFHKQPRPMLVAPNLQSLAIDHEAQIALQAELPEARSSSLATLQLPSLQTIEDDQKAQNADEVEMQQAQRPSNFSLRSALEEPGRTQARGPGWALRPSMRMLIESESAFPPRFCSPAHADVTYPDPNLA